MSIEASKSFEKCYVAAPPGLDLGVLPEVLVERGISWEWARGHADHLPSTMEAIQDADFVTAIVVGSAKDSQVFYEIGIAVGMGKPIFLITRGGRIPPDLNRFSISKVPLNNRDALRLHLDIFLKTPKVDTWEKSFFHRSDNQARIRKLGDGQDPSAFNSDIEERVFNAIEQAGGRAVVEGDNRSRKAYRPDLLAWLGDQEPELLDPTVIEIKIYPVSSKDARRIDERLLRFLQTTGVKTAFVITNDPPPKRDLTISPYIYWLDIEKFETLSRTKQLGIYARETRNRLLHGVR